METTAKNRIAFIPLFPFTIDLFFLAFFVIREGWGGRDEKRESALMPPCKKNEKMKKNRRGREELRKNSLFFLI